MKKETRLLLDKSKRSIVLAIDCYNRQWEVARTESVLIFADHAFEMLMKAYILEKTGRLREPGDNNTYTFSKCLNIGRSHAEAKFLEDNDILALQALNSHRDQAQHYLLDLSPELLYIQAQMAVTLYRDLLKRCFGHGIAAELAHVSLPILPSVPTDPITVFEADYEQLVDLLGPNKRKKLEAESRIRPIAILERSLAGATDPISPRETRDIIRKVKSGESFEQVFPTISSIQFSGDEDGITFSLRINNKEGIPVKVVDTNTPGVTAIALQKVHDWDHYSLNHPQLAKAIGITQPKLTAVIRFLELEKDGECCKFFNSGKTSFRKFSQKAILRVQECLAVNSIDDIWATHRP